MIVPTTAALARHHSVARAQVQTFSSVLALANGREGWPIKICAGLVLAGVLSAAVTAAPVVPAGLLPGEQFHLAFVTAGVIDAQSDDIDVYNTFVTSEAAMSVLTGTSVGVEWFALASTDAVDAIDNAPVSGPIYLLDGARRIADDSFDLWDGSIDDTFDLDQFLVPAAERTWTGTADHGVAMTSANVNALGETFVERGNTLRSTFGWIRDGHGSFENFLEFSLYAVSEAITVPPELHGDATGDGIVGADDYTIWADNFGLTGATQSQGDFQHERYRRGR